MANPRQEDKSTQESIKDMEEEGRRSGERTAEQASRIGQTAAEQTTRVGQAAAEAGEDVARAGADLLKQNAETLQDAMRFGLNMTTTMMGRSADQLGRTLGLSGDKAQDAAERSARNAKTILYSTATMSKVMSGMSKEYFELVRHQIETSMDRMNELWNCRSPQDFAALQSELMREAVGSMLESSRRVADMSIRLADDAADRMAKSMRRAA